MATRLQEGKVLRHNGLELTGEVWRPDGMYVKKTGQPFQYLVRPAGQIGKDAFEIATFTLGQGAR